MPVSFSLDFNSENSYSQDFDSLANLGSNALKQSTAKLAGVYASLATHYDLNPETQSKVEGELTTSGVSPTISTIQDEEKKAKDLEVRNNFQLALDRITQNSTTAMRAPDTLRSLGILVNPEVTQSNIRETALNALARNPIPTNNPDAMTIQRQLSEYEPGKRLSNFQMLGINTEFGEGDFLFTDEERQRIALTGLPVNEKTRNSTATMLANFSTSAIVPGVYTARRGYFFSQLFPEIGNVAEFSNPATAGFKIMEAKRKLNNMPREEYTRFIRERVPEVVRTAANTGFEVGDEDTAYIVDLFQTLTDDPSNEVTSENADLILNTAVGILDSFPIAAYGWNKAGKVLKALRRMSPLENISRADRARAQDLAQRAIDASKTGDTTLADALHVNLADMINEYGMPKSPGSGSQSNIALTDKWDVSQTPLQTQDNSRSFLTPKERAEFEASAEQRLRGGILDRVGDLQLQNSEVRPIAGGFRVSQVVGSTAQDGWTDPAMAKAVAEAILDTGDRDVTLRARNLATGVERPITLDDLELMHQYDQVAGRPSLEPRALRELGSPDRPPRNQEEFFIDVQEDLLVAPEHTLAGEFDAASVGITGRWAKWANKYSLYRKYFANQSSIAEADAEVVTQAIRGVRDTYMNLGYTSMKTANKILNDMDLNGKDLSLAEITRAAAGDIEAVRGVLSVRRWADAMHWNTNRSARRELSNNGYRVLYANIGDRTRLFAKPIKLDEVPMGERIYSVQDNGWNVADELTRLNRAQEGWEVVKLRRPIRIGNQNIQHIWHNRGVPGTRMDKLPINVVARIPGYIPRIYNANYMVARVVRGFNSEGKPYVGREPVSLHHNLDQANRDITARRHLNPDEELIPMGTRELIDNKDEVLLSHLARSGLDYLEDAGRLSISPRGELLRPLTEGAFDGERGPLKDLIESMEIAEFKVGNEAMNRVLAMMTRRWEKDYVEEFGVVNARTGKKEMPMWGDLLGADNANIHRERYDKALADRDHIRLIAGVDRTGHRMWWQDRMRAISDSLVTRYSPDSLPGDLRRLVRGIGYKIGDKTVNLKNTDLFTMARRLNFIRSIVWNPLRQLPLQFASSTIYLATPHAIPYMVTGKLSRDFTAVVTYNLTKDLVDSHQMMDIWAKRLGYTPSEYRTLGEQFDRTGFFQSIDSHSYAVGMYNSAQGAFADSTRAATGVGRLLKNTNNFIRRIGFDTGERGNMLMGYLIERNRAIQEGKNINDPDVFAQLVGDSRAKTLNMGRTGTTAMNQGSAGFMFQFMQFNMRVLQALLPEKILGRGVGKLADKSFTPGEKARMTFFLTAMFGTGGWGAANLSEYATEWYSSVTGKNEALEPEVAEVIREGIFGTAANWTLRSMFNDDSSVLFSSAFSPVGGIAGNLPDGDKLDSNPVVRIFEGIFSQNPDALQELTGPTWVTYKAFREQLGFAYAVLGLPIPFDNAPSLPFDPATNPFLAMDSIARIAPGYNNYVKGRAALSIGRFMDAQGDLLGAEATQGEAYMKMLMGLESVEERDLRDNMAELRGRATLIDPADDRDIQEAAKTFYERTKVMARRLENGEIDNKAFMDAAFEEDFVIRQAFPDPVEYWKFRNFFAAQVMDNLNDKGTDELANLLSNAVRNTNIPSIPSSIARIQNMQSLDPKKKEEIIKYMTTYMELFNNGRLQTERTEN